MQVPGNRLGHDHGLSAAALRAIAEVMVIVAFLGFQTLVLRQALTVNHIVGFGAVAGGVAIVLFGPFTKQVA